MPDADDDSTTTKQHTPPPMPGYLSEQTSVARMVEALETLRFNKHERSQLWIDPGVQAFLIRATKAAAVTGPEVPAGPRAGNRRVRQAVKATILWTRKRYFQGIGCNHFCR